MDKRNGRGRCIRERYDVKNTKSLGTICRNENYIVISVNKVSCSKINSSSIVHINHLFITQQIVKFNFYISILHPSSNINCFKFTTLRTIAWLREVSFNFTFSKDRSHASILREHSSVKFLYKSNQTHRKVHRNKCRNLLLHRIHLFALELCRVTQPILDLLLYLSK